ncbi:SAG-related sequence SRS22B [Toxoplasma gondii p89]|uniref:SAG-related sequence SRS22B n=2 Tax=Toxoplasma gondii TaxID=5811 RepID=A0A2T6INT8_TOXGO|nr:SAG-related sequence SRS22B [Toxoplasma gondii p89]PUA87009.1 SAG-related sequence SRS22B [Toxoplasma gondii TgCATBr9]
MKFSLLALGALALSAQQACALEGRSDNGTTQQGGSVAQHTCKDKPLSFNITDAGQSVIFTCDPSVKNLDPKLEAEQKMYKGTEAVPIVSLLPGATLQAVNSTTVEQPKQRDATGNTFNFTVPALPSEQLELHVNCTATGTEASSRSQGTTNDCQVNFHIASSAVRPVMAASAVAGVIASLLHFV